MKLDSKKNTLESKKKRIESKKNFMKLDYRKL